MANTLMQWPPDEFQSLSQAMDRLFDRRFVRRTGAKDEPLLRLPIDVYETDGDIVVTAALPGADPADVDVTFEHNVLSIRGELKPPLGNVDYWVQEIPYGRFARSLKIGVPLQEDEVSASFDKGMLTVCLPKAAAPRTRTIRINVKQD